MTPQEEILMLRELLKKKNDELKQKDEIIAQKNNIIEKNAAILAKKDDIIAKNTAILVEKDDIIRRQNIQIENMMQALLHARKKMFGRSSETTNQCNGQLSLFDTTEALATELLKHQEKITVSTHKRTPRKPGVRKEMLDLLPKIVEEYVINEEESCSVCGSELKLIGKEIVRTEVEFQPARLLIKQIVRQVTKCTVCGTKDSEYPNDHIQKAAVPVNVLSHSIATASLVAQIMYQKFSMGIPTNRLENDFYRMGLVLSRANMSNWIIRCSEEWLLPVYERIHMNLLKCENLHMDETRIQVNKETGRKASSQSYMWVLQSGTSEKIKATYFVYSRTRSRSVAVEMLEGYHGYLTTDAYTVYENLNLPDIRHNFCWSHVRRYLVESIPLDSRGKELEGSKGAEGREYINLLFKLEKEMREFDYKKKKEKRQVASRAILDAFWTWIDETSAIPTTNEKLTTALNYAKNHRKQLETFLEDGRLDISNNLCESHIRPFATARRSWLFADTPKGARANAVLYTLVESAKANELNIYEYLKHILTVMPNIDFHNHPELVDDLLPWSEKLPDECHLNQRYKKHL